MRLPGTTGMLGPWVSLAASPWVVSFGVRYVFLEVDLDFLDTF